LKIKNREIRRERESSEFAVISTRRVQIQQPTGVDGKRTIRGKRKRRRKFQRKEMLSSPKVFGGSWAEILKLISKMINESVDVGDFLR